MGLPFSSKYTPVPVESLVRIRVITIGAAGAGLADEVSACIAAGQRLVSATSQDVADAENGTAPGMGTAATASFTRCLAVQARRGQPR